MFVALMVPLILMLPALVTVTTSGAGSASEGAPVDLIASVITMIVYALLADRWARVRRLARTAPAAMAE
ncbi:hypothetical protein [Microbacterium sp. A94]|uniref:hypothetical protein n=1 Tax=Microbacterium sp. A94 TaxID=3450717 RepID=UPI003F43F247